MSKRAWSVWSAGQYGDEPHYVRTFADKGEAQRFMRKLARQNGYRYYLKRPKVEDRHVFGKRSSRRYADTYLKNRYADRDASRSRARKDLTLAEARRLASSLNRTDYYAMDRDARDLLSDLLRRTRWRQGPASRAMGRSRLYAFSLALKGHR